MRDVKQKNVVTELAAIQSAIHILEELDDIQIYTRAPVSVRNNTNVVINILIKREEELIDLVENYYV